MRSSAHAAAFDGATARRLLVAVAVSAAFHAIVIGGLRAGAPSLPIHSGVRIEARIAAGDSTVSAEAPLPASAVAADTVAIDATSAPQPSAAVAIEAEPVDASASSKPASAARAGAPMAATPAAEARTTQDAAPVAGKAKDAPSGAQLPFAPDTTYYAIAALDRLPTPLVAPDVCYPQGATGEVTYELLIDETGAVNQATVLEVTPAEIVTAEAAERCSAIRFSPAIKGGRRVRSKVRFVVGQG